MPKGLSGVPSDIRLESLPDPGNRFSLGAVLGSGVSSTVHEAVDTQAGNQKVAIKIQKIIPDYENDIKEEYKILKYLASHPNLPTFHGAYHTKGEVWFVLQLCEVGSIIDLVRGLHSQNRHLSEEQIAFILKETVNAICYLHENHIIHRDIRASNILLTANGEIKIVDFGLSRGLKSTLDKKSTCLGSPCWMAPELIISDRTTANGVSNYDNRTDVWALGITALELAEGSAPYEDMHPTRAIFQIVRNPPPNFRLPSKWSQLYADFVSECLIKIPEERPFIFEFQEHPFLGIAKENIGVELVALKQKSGKVPAALIRPEIHLREGKLQKKICEATEAMVVEDLAAVDEVDEDKIMHILHERFNRGFFYTYIGDMLVFLNPNEAIDVYGNKYHAKYQWKSRSDNSPHIYAVADCAYQDMLHHKEAQNIILGGETLSGKTTNCKHLIDHLLYLGKISNKISDKITAAMQVIQALGNAATAHNNNSTRHVINTQITFTTTGKLSGAIFYLYLLEKWRVSGYKCSNQGNFHIFYYFFDSLKSKGRLSEFSLEDKKYTFLYRRTGETQNPGGAANSEKVNAEMYAQVLRLLEVLEFEPDQIDIVQKILAAIILMGEITFVDNAEEGCDIADVSTAETVAKLLDLDEKKFAWALCNYCVIQKGNAIRKRQTASGAAESLNVLARGFYGRLMDFIVNIINLRLSVTRIVLGDKNFINVLDLPGFEIFEQNNLEQLFNNSLNEQLQLFYNDRVFSWELREQEEEGILLEALQFYDNKPTVDELITKPDGLLYVIDEASRSGSGHSFIMDTLANSPRGTRIRKATSTNFTVAHYCKKVEYNAMDIPQKNRDFLPPEMIETLRLSANFVVKQLFTNEFTKSGNLTISTEQNISVFSGKRRKWSAALVSGDQKSRKFNTETQGEYSQTRRMRTCASVFRAACTEILKTLSDSQYNTNISFVRCVRAGLPHTPGFEADIVSPQLRSLSILDTTHARQVGYSYRVAFKDFIERYKFLAFDFDEPVEVTRENCRLLLIRLKMEGWIIGKNKVFLRYYDKEYLSRLYETQVKKIVKIQAVMRKFITKKKVLPRVKSQLSIARGAPAPVEKKSECYGTAYHQPIPISDEPVETIIYSNARIRGKRIRPKKDSKQDTIRNVIRSNDVSKSDSSNQNNDFVRTYFNKWKSKTIYQVLLISRAKQFLELSNFCQQVHLYNVHIFSSITACKSNECIALDRVDKKKKYDSFIGHPPTLPLGIAFVLNHRSNFPSDRQTLHGSDPYNEKRKIFKDDKEWIALVKAYTRIPRQQLLIAQRTVNVKKTASAGAVVMDQYGEAADNDHNARVTTEMKQFMGRDSIRSISVYSVELPDTPNQLFDRCDEKSGGGINFSETFMQFMCPSCCGGLFSEPKGSVYTKRRPGCRKSDSRSESTIVSMDEYERRKSDAQGGFSSSVGTQRQLATDNIIVEEIVGSNDDGMACMNIKQIQNPKLSRHNTIRENLVVDESDQQNEPNERNEPQKPKLQRDETVHEELHMYSKELTERVRKETSGVKDENGEAKWSNILRKTSFPNNEVTPDATVVELKIGGKDHVEVRKQNGDSDAPFDFQARLRKTNSTRQSLRRFSGISEKFEDETFVIAELLPDVVLEGTVYNL